MTTLTTPEEVAAFLAEHVMGWRLLDRRAKGWGDGPPVWSTGDERNPTFQGFDPWKEVRDMLKALEQWRRSGDEPRRVSIHAFDSGPVFLSLWVGKHEELRGHPRLSRAGCLALCAVNGAEVAIEENTLRHATARE